MTTKFTVKQLAKAKGFFKENPSGTIKIDWTTNWTKADFDRWFMDCLNNKINRNNRDVNFRKLDMIHLCEIERLSRKINNRVSVRKEEVPKCYLKRLNHRLQYD